MAININNNLFVLLFVVGFTFAKFPENVEKCHYGDVDCIKKVATDIIEKHPQGLPELKIPPLEPFHLDNVTFGENAVPKENYDVKLQMTDFNVHGISKFVFDKFVGFEKDPTKSKFEFYGKVPSLKIKAKYNVKGKVLGLPINGEGPLELEIGNVDVSMKVKLKEGEKKDGKTYTKVDKYKTLIDAQSLKVKLENLFKGDKNLGDSMNELLNKNWQTLWAETKPDVSKIVGKFAVDILNEFLSSEPYEDLFLAE